MMSNHIFSLCNVHVLQLGDICLKLINRLRLILLGDDGLDGVQFLAEDALQTGKVLVSDLLEYLVFIGQEEHEVWCLGSILRVFRGIWLHDIDIHSDSTSLDLEVLIQQSLISLVDAERRYHVNSSVNEEQTVYLRLNIASSI
jgi:hypothetical protein